MMSYVRVYYDWQEAIDALSDGECGRLFKALLLYAHTEETMELPGGERYVWPMVKAQIDADMVCRREISAKRSEAGRRGGKPSKKTADQASKAIDCNCLQLLSQEKEKSEEKNEEKREEKERTKEREENREVKREGKREKEGVRPPLPPRGEVAAWFDQFWAAYPRKDNKAVACKKYLALVKDAETRDAILAALAWQKDALEWTKRGWQYTPMASTWLHQERWKDPRPGEDIPAETPQMDAYTQSLRMLYD